MHAVRALLHASEKMPSDAVLRGRIVALNGFVQILHGYCSTTKDIFAAMVMRQDTTSVTIGYAWVWELRSAARYCCLPSRSILVRISNHYLSWASLTLNFSRYTIFTQTDSLL